MIKALAMGVKAAATSANPAGALFHLLWKPVLVLVLLAAVVWGIRDGGYDKAKAEDAAHISQLETNLTAADQARAAAIGANESLAASELAMREALAACTAENTRVLAEGEAGVAKAQAEKAAEAAKAKAWESRYRQILDAPACKDALAMMARACPVEDF